MTKGTYSIRHSKGTEPRIGWLDGRFGYFKEKSGWIATDLATGLAYNMSGYPTRSQLQADIAQNAEEIVKGRQTDYYKRFLALAGRAAS